MLLEILGKVLILLHFCTKPSELKHFKTFVELLRLYFPVGTIREEKELILDMPSNPFPPLLMASCAIMEKF